MSWAGATRILANASLFEAIYVQNIQDLEIRE